VYVFYSHFVVHMDGTIEVITIASLVTLPEAVR
jgi:hypothetical protein